MRDNGAGFGDGRLANRQTMSATKAEDDPALSGPDSAMRTRQMHNGRIILSFRDALFLIHCLAPKSSPLQTPVKLHFEDILSAMLLFGGATLVVPPALKRLCAEPLSPLVSDELLTIHIDDYSKPSRVALSRRLDEAHKNIVGLEFEPTTASLLSLQAKWSYASKRRAVAAAAWANDACEDVVQFANSALTSIGDVLMHSSVAYTMAHAGTMASDLDGFVGMGGEGRVLARLNELFSSPDALSEMMLLRRLSLVEAEAVVLSPDPFRAPIPFNYSGSDLRELWRIDRRMFDTSLESHTMKALDVGLRGRPADYIALHSFWRVLFETINLIQYSRKTGGHIFLPASRSDGIQVPQRSLPAQTSQDALGVFQCYLTKNTVFPRIDNIDTLRRLREDKRIAPFQEKVHEWIARLRDDSTNISSAMERDIRLAEREMKTFDLVRRVAGISAIVALPLAIVYPATAAISFLGLANWSIMKPNPRFSWVQLGR
jgi:hypothetical protein